jgi:hypothetical protein
MALHARCRPVARLVPLTARSTEGRPRPVRPAAALSLVALLACLMTPGGAGSAVPALAAAAEGACTVVFGHGRNLSEDDPQANRSWDEANRAMATQVAAELAARGQRVVRLLLPVTVTDVPAIVEGVLQRAVQQGCGRIVESTLFADEDAGLIVARLRAYGVEPARGPQAPARIGATLYTHQQEFPRTERNLQRLVPATLGKALATDYLDRPQR